MKTHDPHPSPVGIFSYRKFWAERFGTAPVLPMSLEEMETLGWDSCDVILITGDAYVDHPSFGMALIGRLLEAQGFRVGIISQPAWKNAQAFMSLGKPNLFFGVTSGNMESMVNHYTSERKIRSNDAYTPNGSANRRPDRASIVYAQRCKEAYPDVPVILGGLEASLRRTVHYDYWSDSLRRSILLDSKADLLIYGNAERAIVEVAHRLAQRKSIQTITDVRGSAFIIPNNPPPDEDAAVILPSYEAIQADPTELAKAHHLVLLEANPYHARILIQVHGKRSVQINPPAFPLSTPELDQVYELPFSREPHPSYQGMNIPAYEMIRFSVSIMRGCFGGCTFCSLAAHEGRIIQSRSESSVLKEIEDIRDRTPGFTGIISDLGGPTANMYRMNCQHPQQRANCRRLSCIYPAICKNLITDHKALIQLYRKARELPGIKKVLIGSGVRYDLAIKSPEYIKELVSHHVGGYLKIAPEHICEGPLSKMMKPGIDRYDRFKQLFDQFSKAAGKEQYIVPYFIAAHPGTTDDDMLELALWLKANHFRLEQVQTFLPTPMTLATAMYYSGTDPLASGQKGITPVFVPKGEKIRKLHKAFLRYHDPHNWPLLRAALKRMGREDLIGSGKRHLIPAWQPK